VEPEASAALGPPVDGIDLELVDVAEPAHELGAALVPPIVGVKPSRLAAAPRAVVLPTAGPGGHRRRRP
jgi:hypothetical protein